MGQSPLVKLRDVTVRYGHILAVNNLSFSVGNGEIVALIGPSGAGKSTVLGLCSGQVAPADGTVCFENSPIEDTDVWRRTHGSKIALIAQKFHLANRMQVIHNVNAGRLGRWSTFQSLWSLVRPSGRTEVLAILEKLGIGDKVNSRVDELSGGQQQRVAIARALRQEPSLLLADEPTASLDPTRAAEVMELLRNLCVSEGLALVVSQHDVHLALKYCDRVIGLREGAIVFDLPATEVELDTVEALYRTDRLVPVTGSASKTNSTV